MVSARRSACRQRPSYPWRRCTRSASMHFIHCGSERNSGDEGDGFVALADAGQVGEELGITAGLALPAD